MSRSNSTPAGPHGALAMDASLENRPSSAVVLTPTHAGGGGASSSAGQSGEVSPKANNWMATGNGGGENGAGGELRDARDDVSPAAAAAAATIESGWLPPAIPQNKGKKGHHPPNRQRHQSIATAAIEQTKKNVAYKQVKENHMDKVNAVAGEYQELVDTEGTTKGMFASEMNEIRKFLVSPSLQQYFIHAKLPAVVPHAGQPSFRQPLHPNAAPPRGKVNYSTLFQEQKELEEKVNTSLTQYTETVRRLEDERKNLSRGWSLLLMDHNTGNGVLQTVQPADDEEMDEEDDDDIQGYTVEDLAPAQPAAPSSFATDPAPATAPASAPAPAPVSPSSRPTSARSALANRPTSANRNRPSSANRQQLSARAISFKTEVSTSQPQPIPAEAPAQLQPSLPIEEPVRKDVLPTVFGDAAVPISSRTSNTAPTAVAPAPSAAPAQAAPVAQTIEPYTRPMSSQDMRPSGGTAPSTKPEEKKRPESPGPNTMQGSGSIASDVGTNSIRTTDSNASESAKRKETSILTSAPPLTNQPLTSSPVVEPDVAAIVRRCCGELGVESGRYIELLAKNLFVTRSDMVDISLDEYLLMDFPLKLAKTIRKAFTTGTAPPPQTAPLRPAI